MKTLLEDLEDLSAVVLVPTAAFREVLLKADPSLASELDDYFEHSDSQTVVLVPTPEDDEDLEETLLPHKAELARKELEHWIEAAERRPAIDPQSFDRWFEVRFHSIVLAVGEEE